MVKVLFVCLGNICRSPMAEGLFADLVVKSGLEAQFEIDSCGTSGWHVGEQADRRMRQTAGQHGIELTSLSRKLTRSDFTRFDYIIPMDRSNLRDVLELQEQVEFPISHIILMRDFDEQGKGQGVPDPYYGGDDGFEQVYQILLRSCTALLNHIRKETGI